MKSLSEILFEKLVINKNTKIKEKDSEDPTTWEEGDILCAIGGWEMVLVDFYKIIKSTGKSFVVKELKQKIVSGNGMRGKCVAIEDEFESDAKEIKCRINKYNSVKIDSSSARLWDGEPVYFDRMN